MYETSARSSLVGRVFFEVQKWYVFRKSIRKFWLCIGNHRLQRKENRKNCTLNSKSEVGDVIGVLPWQKSKGLKSVIPLSLSNQVLEALGHSLLFEMKGGYSIAKCQTSVPLTFCVSGDRFSATLQLF